MLVGTEEVSTLLAKLETCDNDLTILQDMKRNTKQLVGIENHTAYLKSVNHLLSNPIPLYDNVEVGRESISSAIKSVIKDAINFITELFARLGLILDRAANINSIMQTRIMDAFNDMDGDYVYDSKDYNKLNDIGYFKHKDLFTSIRSNINLVKFNFVELNSSEMDGINAMVKQKIGMLRYTKRDADDIKSDINFILNTKIKNLPYTDFKPKLEKLYEKDKAVHFHVFEEPKNWSVTILNLHKDKKSKNGKQSKPSKDKVKSLTTTGRIIIERRTQDGTLTAKEIEMLVNQFTKSIDDYNFVEVKAVFQERIKDIRKEIKDVDGNKKSDIRTIKVLLGIITYLSKLSKESVTYVHRCHTTNYKVLKTIIDEAGS